jgi:hypothetical protein
VTTNPHEPDHRYRINQILGFFGEFVSGVYQGSMDYDKETAALAIETLFDEELEQQKKLVKIDGAIEELSKVRNTKERAIAYDTIVYVKERLSELNAEKQSLLNTNSKENE